MITSVLNTTRFSSKPMSSSARPNPTLTRNRTISPSRPSPPATLSVLAYSGELGGGCRSRNPPARSLQRAIRQARIHVQPNRCRGRCPAGPQVERRPGALLLRPGSSYSDSTSPPISLRHGRAPWIVAARRRPCSPAAPRILLVEPRAPGPLSSRAAQSAAPAAVRVGRSVRHCPNRCLPLVRPNAVLLLQSFDSV